MSDKAMDEIFSERVFANQQHAGAFGLEEPQPFSTASLAETDPAPRSSPAGRMAACHPDDTPVERSQAFVEVMKQVGRVSNTNLPVLLTGECGTGKELVASAIHRGSDRADQPFVSLNCKDNGAESIESELLGYGTVFLNDITQTTASFQMTLLRALETGEIQPAGSDEPTKINARVIAASSRDLEQEVAAGRFDSELFARLKEVSIALPPLREQPEEIPLLAQDFAFRVYQFSPPVKFSDEALALMERYSWPGNIRELENAVVRAAVICDGTIRVKDLPQRVRNYTQKQSDTVSAEAASNNGHAPEEWVPLSEIEGRYVAQVLEHTRGNKQAAARVLAVDRKTLDRMIKRHHIDSEKVRRVSR